MWSSWWFCRMLVMLGVVMCNPVSMDFNNSIRSYSVKDEDAIVNSTAKTLQQEELGRYAGFAPSTNPIRFKDVPDNVLSGSQYSRGLAHEHGGYGPHDFDEGHYGYGYDYDHHGFDQHHVGHHGHHGHHGPHFGHGHHYHKQLSHHALAAKTILWPLAGLAILGTAAALVTNPVLLQLGVISGRRRRDTTEETKSDFNFALWDVDDKVELEDYEVDDKKNVVATNIAAHVKSPKNRAHKDVKQDVTRRAYPIQSTIETAVNYSENNDFGEDRLVPIAPLKVKLD